MTRSKKKLISIIIPTYNQKKIIRRSIRRVRDVMDQLRYDYEIIVVVDGGDYKAFSEAKLEENSKVKVFGYRENKGKGHAVRHGMAKAKGDVVSFIDADLDIKPNGISMLLEHFEWYSADIIVGSKLHPVSKVKYPLPRLVLSWGYRTLVKILFGLSIKDTQVGIKLFRKKVIQDVLPRLLVKTYAFDIEILAVSYYLGYKRIYEAPVELDFAGVSAISSKNFWKVILHMLWDTLAVFYRLKILHYYTAKKWTKSRS